ncbi:carboxymuconolactone decarboxylase family protein [Pseudonocardia abyssalis]|jgi:4-carboxymuconolactone decarboxylase|uniref:Carboxymuconolactone decarboxylase family protein n=1 Tax=Pseudonocardia abyssalis TaxID=2792008 RepID=A0ABS6UNF0_9PSEU|nr:carboxymuconolactone decarboxylase family protein [Pseudonocardia abyssalis]MBW0115100.1 carboxymuconolactone decarboxylase family protein [Pseudonocardia abyssalis]MBW0133760.1 carboxymuconolactone decarboxylase family protein [Pseudonocardia abyssalis]
MRDPEDVHVAEGLAVRQEVFGTDLVERNYTNASAFSRPAQDWIAGAVWADVWTRDGLDRRTRSLVTLAMLTALNRPTEFESHVRAALTNGCTVADIQELLLHTAPYCGAPAALQAFRQAERVLAETDRADPGTPTS